MLTVELLLLYQVGVQKTKITKTQRTRTILSSHQRHLVWHMYFATRLAYLMVKVYGNQICVATLPSLCPCFRLLFPQDSVGVWVNPDLTKRYYVPEDVIKVIASGTGESIHGFPS